MAGRAYGFGMRDRELYARILGLELPWRVTDVELDQASNEVRVIVEHGVTDLSCPECGAACSGYDTRRRSWRHLDTCQFKTILVADIPRVRCEEHGVRQLAVPWAEPGSRFTALFESLVIDWLREASVAAVARRVGLSWDQVGGIMERAVKRGLARRGSVCASRIGVDETSFQKRHEYVMIVADLDAEKPCVLHVADDRKQATLQAYYDSLTEAELDGIQVVSMDMWGPFIEATKACVQGADRKICFDKFHVASHLGDAVNTVRKQEHRALMAEDDDRLKRTKHLWLQNPDNMSEEQWTDRFEALRTSSLKTARAWAVKEHAMTLWSYVSRGWAEKAWKRLVGWMARTRLEPVRKVGRMIKRHLWGILNAITHGVTNARLEGINSRVQWVKKMACGYRSRDGFRAAIYFHLGNLDLHPRPQLAHTIS